MEKEKQKKRIIRAAVLLVIAVLIAVWWLMPIRILKGYRPEDITKIEIDGISNRRVTLTDETVVRTIADNLYTCGAVKSGISYARMGTVYDMFLYAGDKCIRRFCVIDTEYARDGVFFYKPKNGELIYCKKYLDTLSEEYRKTE